MNKETLSLNSVTGANSRALVNYEASLYCKEHIDFGLASQLTHFIVHTSELSKQGTVSLASISGLLKLFTASQKKILLQIDIPCFNDDLPILVNSLGEFIEQGVVLRIEDVGLARLLLTRYPNMLWHLILAYHSKTALAWQGWIKYFGNSLKRLVISAEIPYLDLKNQQIIFKKTHKNVDIEILGAGKLTIFYSTRTIDSEVGHYQLSQPERDNTPNLRMFKSKHGFCVYFGQDIFILDLHEQILSSQPDVIRLDFYRSIHWNIFNRHYPQNNWQENVKREWASGTSYGFFMANRTDSPFRLLKNKNLSSIDPAKIVGASIEYVRDSHNVIKLEKNIKLPKMLTFITPEGFILKHCLENAENIFNHSTSNNLSPGYYLIKAVKKAVPKSVIIDETS
ncbi:MAG: hypothetical protein JJV97_04555 [SAR324 cluster bacterium]|nr:hypothetical protein [SAR324 cluster bacterium]